MKGIFSIFRKDDRAFTGLESAIVLTAFVVVAAVFSYVVLGAGFTTSDAAKKTIDEGVKQTTSSIELAGDVIAIGGTAVSTTIITDGDPETEGDQAVTAMKSPVDKIIITLQLTAGQSPVDIGRAGNGDGSEILVVSYADSSLYEDSAAWSKEFVGENDGDDILEQHEKVKLTVTVPDNSLLANSATAPNSEFRLEIKPKVGAIVPVTRVIPAQIDPVMVLK
ncbi:archaellin/type IV pilin N-terminal domain-containing protein [Methanosarcina mazei]|uniref:Flagellin n=2 Tax=Methanosarcina mazei TaxID=2209 RepID=A0A0F8IVA3_METMZ|nr:archaellin/type IV pilin N-terminal domain-containing protein [Methanosarcina mazei]AKB70765.1 Flagellin FlaB1 [Methanosarcina mazei C16]KKG61431.1 flagellin [Methanosarcina mazei]KKG67398.1 flagellin [Methanosarcina mazei]KKG84568.1 flagellin [Methanosarcina mazei]KKG87694.1 flagellin [Methanosarcina mazei]